MKKNITSVETDTIRGAKITANATIKSAIIGLIGGFLVAFVALIPGCQSNEYQALHNQYRELKAEYAELEEKYNMLYKDSAEKYWMEYTAKEGDVIADKTAGCAILIKYIYSSLGSITLDLGEGKEYCSADINRQMEIDEEGRYSLLLLETIDGYPNQCRFIIREN